ncbi:MAG TPA: hypothetical protein VK466_00925 [Terriglobales bacterium]|nr:hypothetical protein [Terriglobales bacterium]
MRFLVTAQQKCCHDQQREHGHVTKWDDEECQWINPRRSATPTRQVGGRGRSNYNHQCSQSGARKPKPPMDNNSVRRDQRRLQQKQHYPRREERSVRPDEC